MSFYSTDPTEKWFTDEFVNALMEKEEKLICKKVRKDRGNRSKD